MRSVEDHVSTRMNNLTSQQKELHRLMVTDGIPGIGKTRLCDEMASKILPSALKVHKAKKCIPLFVNFNGSKIHFTPSRGKKHPIAMLCWWILYSLVDPAAQSLARPSFDQSVPTYED